MDRQDFVKELDALAQCAYNNFNLTLSSILYAVAGSVTEGTEVELSNHVNKFVQQRLKQLNEKENH